MDGHSEPPPFLSWAAEVVTQCFHHNSWDTFPAAACIRERVPGAISFSRSPGVSRFSLVLASSITLSCLNSTWMWNAGTVLRRTFERSRSNLQRKQQVHLKSWKAEFKTDASQDNFQPKVWNKTGYFQKVNESSPLCPYPSPPASANNPPKPSHTRCSAFLTDAAVFAKAVWAGRLSPTHGNASEKLTTSREATPHCPKSWTPEGRCAEGWGGSRGLRKRGRGCDSSTTAGAETEGRRGARPDRPPGPPRVRQGHVTAVGNRLPRLALGPPSQPPPEATDRVPGDAAWKRAGKGSRGRWGEWLRVSVTPSPTPPSPPARQRGGRSPETRRAEGSAAASRPQPLPAPPPALTDRKSVV